MAKENNTSIVSAATSYLPDNDMLRCCHLIQRNKKTNEPTSDNTVSSKHFIRRIAHHDRFPLWLRAETKHPSGENLVFLGVFSLFLKAWKTGLVYIHSEGGGCSLTKDNDNFSLLSDTVVKQHGFLLCNNNTRDI